LELKPKQVGIGILKYPMTCFSRLATPRFAKRRKYIGFVKRVIRWVSHVEQELHTLSEHLCSPMVFSDVLLAVSLVFCVILCLSYCPFCFGLYIVYVYAEERVCNYIDKSINFKAEFENRSIHVFRNPTEYSDFKA
jgi:hypothetical protein